MRIDSSFEGDDDFGFDADNLQHLSGAECPDVHSRIEPFLTYQSAVRNRLAPYFQEQERLKRVEEAAEYARMSKTLEAWRSTLEQAERKEIQLDEQVYDRLVQYWNRMVEIVVVQRRRGRLSDSRRYERLSGMQELLGSVQSAQSYSYVRKLQFDHNF